MVVWGVSKQLRYAPTYGPLTTYFPPIGLDYGTLIVAMIRKQVGFIGENGSAAPPSWGHG